MIGSRAPPTFLIDSKLVQKYFWKEKKCKSVHSFWVKHNLTLQCEQISWSLISGKNKVNDKPKKFETCVRFSQNRFYQFNFYAFLVSFLNNAECQPCRKDWILFQEKCYLFYLQPSPWKTWGDSRKYCQDAQADLVVIGSLQEQVSAPY